MRTLHVNDHRWFLGGVERYLSRLAYALDNMDESGMALAHAYPSPPDAPDVPFRCAAFIPELDPPRPHDAPRAARALLAFGREVDAEVIYFHDYLDQRVIATVAENMPVVMMIHVHNVYCPTGTKYLAGDTFPCPRQRGWGCLPQLALRGCGSRRPQGVADMISVVSRNENAARFVHHVIANSHYVRDELIRNGVLQERISVAPYFLSSQQIPKTSTPPTSTAQGLPIVLAPMRVTREKGALLLPDVARGLAGRAELWVAGSGWLFDELQAQATDISNLRLLGACDDDRMQLLYAAASVVLVPSLWPEPFGIVGLEAMAHSRPAVAFARGGISDWLVDGVTGLLVRQGDAQALTSAILHLLDDPQRAAKYGHAGRQRVLAEFTAEPHLATLNRVNASACATFGNCN